VTFFRQIAGGGRLREAGTPEEAMHVLEELLA
jgi:hypothetical protein